ncbi:Aspartyl protease, partial [Phytophthora infestans]
YFLSAPEAAATRRGRATAAKKRVDLHGVKPSIMKMSTDANGDVAMTVPQPVFEAIQPPSLMAWDQASLVAWVRQRRQYEAKVRNRCAITGERFDQVVTSIRDSIEPRILEHLARFVLKKKPDSVTDEDLGLAITRRCSSLQNSHIPDIDQLFGDRLKMDLRIEDTEARILDYFVLFDKIVEDHGLNGISGSGSENEPTYGERMKLRCKTLLKYVALDMLKLGMERLAIAKPVLKKDDIALYEALVERAREQQHYHLLSQELRMTDKPRGNTNSKKTFSTFKPRAIQQQGPSANRLSTKPARKELEKSCIPPRDGCLVCSGAHWVKEYPVASEADKEAALQRMNDMKNQRLRAKAGDRAAIMNNVLEVPFRADTGADCNVITRQIVHELQKLDAGVSIVKLATPIEVEVADGRLVQCYEQCEVDVQLLTAAGPVHLRHVTCVIIDGDTDELLVGDVTLKSLGIDVDQLLEQLASKSGLNSDGDDLPDDDIDGLTNSEEIAGCLDTLLEAAKAAGFPQHAMAKLHDVVMA